MWQKSVTLHVEIHNVADYFYFLSFGAGVFLHVSVAAKELCSNALRQRIAWLKLSDLLFEGGHLISLGIFGCSECCSCRFLFHIMSWDSCSTQRYFSSVFDGFAAFARFCTFCAALKFLLVLFQCAFLLSKWDWRWFCFLVSRYLEFKVCFYVVYVAHAFSICIRGTGLSLVRRASCLWGHCFWRAFFFCGGHGSVLVDIVQFLIFCEGGPSVVEAGYGWVSFECCRLKLTFRELVLSICHGVSVCSSLVLSFVTWLLLPGLSLSCRRARSHGRGLGFFPFGWKGRQILV